MKPRLTILPNAYFSTCLYASKISKVEVSYFDSYLENIYNLLQVFFEVVNDFLWTVNWCNYLSTQDNLRKRSQNKSLSSFWTTPQRARIIHFKNWGLRVESEHNDWELAGVRCFHQSSAPAICQGSTDSEALRSLLESVDHSPWTYPPLPSHAEGLLKLQGFLLSSFIFWLGLD